MLGEARGRLYAQDELARHFSHALFPRTSNRYGCVTLHSYHFYIEEGLPHKRVLLWVYGDRLRAEFENVVLAEYRCRYDWKESKIKDLHDPVIYQTPFASPQQDLIPLSEQEWIAVYRPKSKRAPRAQPVHSSVWQLVLFELVPAA